jgi:hypothetical protein
LPAQLACLLHPDSLHKPFLFFEAALSDCASITSLIDETKLAFIRASVPQIIISLYPFVLQCFPDCVKFLLGL